MQNKYALELKNISHRFPADERKESEAISDISINIERGKFVSIVGPSGCGKSTLLRIALGLLKPIKGEVIRNFQKYAMVFQNFAIFPWLSVYDNIEFGLKMSGMKKEHAEKIVSEKIKEVGLAGFENMYPKELSGGMKQRVGIARALAMSPEVLFMDEPFSSLDTITARRLKDDLAHIWEKYDMTVVMVTHLIEEAVELSDDIIVVSQRPAHVKETLTVNLPRPRNLRSQNFFDMSDKITGLIDM
ncbi:MAG: ABC transporter ATP-binding protein [Candidatus Paceibacterota bacterium]|jgi:NitT/TauT family transport system ATP-binding protein